MADQTPTQQSIAVGDAAQAAGRYVTVLVLAFVALAGFLKARDAVSAIAYVQANAGQLGAAVAGLVSLGTAAYGVLKTHKRGAQAAPVVAAERASDAATKA